MIKQTHIYINTLFYTVTTATLGGFFITHDKFKCLFED